MPEETTSAPASPVRPTARHVFVYGTLRRGGTNDITRLTPAPTWVGAATLPGVLYTLGAYPGMRLTGHSATDAPVRGEVYAISPELEVQLDRIEGLAPGAVPLEDDEYIRREVEVIVDGRPIACLMYEIHERFAAAPQRLTSGDWLSRASIP